MPKARPFQCSFTRGEISPLLYGRFDLEWYFNAAKRVENFLPIPQGGLVRRWGWYYAATTKTSSKLSRLIPFEFSTTQAYVLEFGDNYIRVMKDGAQIITGASEGADLVTNGTFPVNITGWTDKSSANAAIVWVSAYMRLYVIAPGSWYGAAEQGITTEVGASYKLRFDIPFGSLYLRIGTSSGGQEIYSPTLFAIGTNYSVDFIATSTTTYIGFYTRVGSTVNNELDNVSCKKQITPVPVEVTTTYTETELSDVAYCQSADTLYLVHPSHSPAKLLRTSHTSWTLSDIVFDPPPSYEADTDLSGGTITLTPAAVTGANIQFDASNNCFLASDVDRAIKYGAARAVIITVDSATRVHADIEVDFPNTDAIAAGSWFLDGSPVCECTPSKTRKGAKCTLTLAANGWRTADVGKYVQIHDGMLKILSRTSATEVKAKILSTLSAKTATEDWTLEVAAWDATRGYPRAVAFFEGRLWFAGSDAQPDTIWGSRSQDYENFAIGADPDDAVRFTINAMQVNVIQWLCSGKTLLAGTYGEEFPLKAPDGPIAPDNPPELKSDSIVGASSARPVRIDDRVFFIQAMKRKLIDYGFDWEKESQNGIDRSIMSEHITEGGIEELAYQQEPYSIVWARRGDGMLLAFTYHYNEKVYAWSRQPTDGDVESICVVTDAINNHHVLYAVINRDINGVSKRFIEYLDPDLYVDCGLTYSGVAATTLSGLAHLIGETVSIRGDGATYPDTVVDANGQVSVTPAVEEAQIGLSFTSILETLPPEIVLGGSTSQGKKKHRGEIFVRVNETGPGMTINGDVIPLRTSEDDMDEAVPLFTGDLAVTGLGSDETIVITQSTPQPCTILAIFGDVEIEP